MLVMRSVLVMRKRLRRERIDEKGMEIATKPGMSELQDPSTKKRISPLDLDPFRFHR
jgi:hypothetical protein